MTVADYPSYSKARSSLRGVLDVAESGRCVTIEREGRMSAVVSVDRLKAFLSSTVAPGVRVFRENGVVIALMDGRPFVSEGTSTDDAIGDLILTLREYSEDWFDHLYLAPNHEEEWGLAQLVRFSTDDELLTWIEGSAA